MPRKYPAGGESRLSLEGLKGADIDGRTVESVYAHQVGNTRTIYFTDGSRRRVPKWKAVALFLEHKGVEGVTDAETRKRMK